MIYEQNCYNLNIKYFDNLIEINIKNIPNKFIRFKIYENILHFFKLYKLNTLIKYYDKEFLICNELYLKNVLRNYEYIRYMNCSDFNRCKKFDLIEVNDIFICKSCNVIFNKPFKIIIICCRKNLLIENQISPHCKNCKKFVCI